MGNSLEVQEAIDTCGAKAADLEELSIILAAHMLVLGGRYSSFDSAIVGVEILDSGRGLDKFKQMITAQEEFWTMNGLIMGYR